MADSSSPSSELPPTPPSKRRSTRSMSPHRLSASTRSLLGNPVHLLPAIRTTSHLSALAFSTFLVVHLASPVASALHTGVRLLSGHALSDAVEGSTDAANGYLLLGRVWYRPGAGESAKIGWTESVIVWGSLAVHVGCGIAKRGILVGEQVKRRRRRKAKRAGLDGDIEGRQQQDRKRDQGSSSTESEATSTSPSPPSSSASSLPSPSLLHALTGHLLVLPLSAHVLLTRLGPAVRSLSGSGRNIEVDHTLVAHGLVSESGTRTAAMSWAVLVGTTALSAWHVASGTHLIGQSMAAKSKARRRRQAAAAGLPDPAASAASPPPSSRRKQLARTAQPALLGSAAVLAGAACIATDYAHGGGLAVGPWVKRRFDEVYRGTWPWSS
ncbi:hypothetical protein BDZ90DRAFT_35211 [Jaminaea rosea]|uniref:Mitochondrial adapter protein MCP1 transmembrane domain-containing protein n=1 Tax=Jaminaea rosea TaxID=1569628 RepID=A0A316V1I2_9BASI|nr:hypothetical protein BDZ90DRAFT_35211 [Jaminaea rosea]PWN31114.1 hypothetical protein BDZ90DRAFT_35211 [Jaminaea rosea]